MLRRAAALEWLATLRWPLPAVLSWGVAAMAYAGLRVLTLGPWPAAIGASVLAVGLASQTPTTGMRRAWMALGFPLAWALLQGTGESAGAAQAAWAWLLGLAALLALYPLGAWRDAPLFPTPHDAFEGLAAALPLGPEPTVLDAGCGLGDGLLALARAWPQARLEGVERSAVLAWLCARRLPQAHIRRGDLWQADWSVADLVYLFQRPESMPRAWDKAQRDMRPGTWLASLEFPIPGRPADAEFRCPDGRILWLYRIPASSPRSGGQ
ncbi:class I SAM-dependent methyltransferase [Tibeticola sp.]|uniref:class I SAM-dependent methyltransferase n=1 Tax=Tibeticola sp. TaxID=2005368 RepID=UPI00258416AC|nr:class I SAM-dependent methyltransferase [Tibeticola sp.]MCI4441311.1 class I SAM-dependent methyltransferase [Tibeticola sp.]